MLTIDGSRLEGGGQILRMAVALSALTGTEVEVEHIRANRPRPGLAPQHVAAVRAVAGLCSGQSVGLEPGSTRLRFAPGDLGAADTAIDVGTAGSIPLVLQAWLPAALEKGGSITIRGGTEVSRSPTIDYFQRVFLPILARCGARTQVEIVRRGYYPQGGGEVRMRVESSALSPIEITQHGSCGLISCSANLPDHVAERQARAARNRLKESLGIEVEPVLDRRSGSSTGTSCTVWCGAKGGIALGERGLPAEKVGRLAADRLIEACQAPGTVDLHLSDQLMVYLARFGGTFTTSELTLHSRTMHWLLSEFGYAIQLESDDQVKVRA